MPLLVFFASNKVPNLIVIGTLEHAKFPHAPTHLLLLTLVIFKFKLYHYIKILYLWNMYVVFNNIPSVSDYIFNAFSFISVQFNIVIFTWYNFTL